MNHASCLLLVALFLAHPLVFDTQCVAQTASVAVETKTPSMNVPFTLQIQVEGSNVRPPQLLEIDGLDLASSGQSTSINIVNGRMSRTSLYNYQAMATKEGTLTIPSIVFGQGTTKLTTKPLILSVKKGNILPPTRPGPGGPTPPGSTPNTNQQPPAMPAIDEKSVFLKVVPEREQIYTGEAVEVKVKAYIDDRISLADFDRQVTLQGEDFVFQPVVGPDVSLQNQLKTMSDIPGRNALDRRIRDLNQKNLTAQIQLDQERARVEDLRKQLDDASDIKRGVLERGQSASLKVDLLSDELTQARGKIQSLENALINAREAIRVLQSGGSGSNSIPVSLSNPSRVSRNSTFLSSQQSRALPPTVPIPSVTRFPPTSQSSGFSSLRGGRQGATSVQNIPSGDSSVQLKAEVQFLNNKRRPAGFTEFFLVEQSLDSIMQNSMIRIPRNEGIETYAELWARSIQRGYRFPGVAASIRNSLARSSLTRLKTNSVGEANLDNLKSGSYFVVGASTLGQVGVVWSKPIILQNGENNVKLDLRDAVWAE